MECAKAAAETGAQPGLRPARRRRADDLPEHRRARLHRAAAGAASGRALPSRDGRTQYTDATGLPRTARAHQRLVRAALRPGDRRRRASSSPPARRRRCSWPAWRWSSAATRCCCPTRATRATAISSPPPTACRCCCRPAPPSASSSAPQRSTQAWTQRTRGVLLASPSNPTGTSIDPDEMGRIVEVGARARRLHAGRRDLPRAELRRALRPQRAGTLPRRRRDLDQQLLQVLQHDRLAAGLAGRAAGAGARRSRSWRRTCTSAPSTRGPACGAGLLRARVDRRIRTPARRVPQAPRLRWCRRSTRSACRCR